jgi:hypothetical protein
MGAMVGLDGRDHPDHDALKPTHNGRDSNLNDLAM